MIGVAAFFAEFSWVVVTAVCSVVTIWVRCKHRPKVPFLIPFVFSVVFAFALTIFVRQIDGMWRLERISSSEIAAITYEGRYYTDPSKIAAIAGSLQRSQWYHLRR